MKSIIKRMFTISENIDEMINDLMIPLNCASRSEVIRRLVEASHKKLCVQGVTGTQDEKEGKENAG